MKELTYLASPYTHVHPHLREMRFQSVCKVAGELMLRGYKIYSPIAHTHPIAVYGSLPIHWDFWKQYDMAILDCCKEMFILTLDGWLASKGIRNEFSICRDMGIPVSLVDKQCMISPLGDDYVLPGN